MTLAKTRNVSPWFAASILSMAVTIPTVFSADPPAPTPAAAAPAVGGAAPGAANRGAAAAPARGAVGGGLGRGAAVRPAYIEEGYDDHKNMMDQLGIVSLRPGKSGQNQTGPGFDLATANAWMPTMPDVLKMKDGTKVTTPAQWTKRRAEIVEDFEREVYGRIPANVPKVTWEVTATTEGESGGIPTVTKTLVGRVDNSAFPQITVNIQGSFTIPKNTPGPVPILIEFGGPVGGGLLGGGGLAGARGGLNAAQQTAVTAMNTSLAANTQTALTAREDLVAAAFSVQADAASLKTKLDALRSAELELAQARATAFAAIQSGDNKLTAEQVPTLVTQSLAPPRAGLPAGARGVGAGAGGPATVTPPWTQQAITHGWAYGYMSPGSVQADAGGNALRQGIIGLVNKGQPRKPEDWGALRAWQWGISEMINYFEATPDAKVDPKKVGVEGVSRYGKAALVTGAFETRLAVAFVASSGEGGAKLHRHDFGEALENLTGGEYYWMGGNILKYGAKESKLGELNASNLPVDSHQLIALCAPRLCLVSYGVESQGDPKWVDAPGSFMAAVGAGPVYKLLGKKDLGTSGDYLNDPMPPVNQLIGGELAWRQHSGGHTSVPNFPTFFEWVGRYITTPAASAK